MPFESAETSQPGVAQLVARLLWEQDAAGSNPVTRTTFRRKTAFLGGFSAIKVHFPSFARPHFNCGQRGKMAIITAVQKNYENRQIPNPSLIGIAQVFSPQIRRKLEFSSIIPYNDSTVSLCATKAAVWVYSHAAFLIF